MDFPFLPIFALLCLVLKASDASPSAEAYWQSILPNTPMPKVLLDLIETDVAGKKLTFLYTEERYDTCRAVYGVGYWPDKKAIPNTTTIYFLYKDLNPGKKMDLVFMNSKNGSLFLPQKIAKAIPFTTNKLHEIFTYFSIKPTSKEAQMTKQTIQECEAPTMQGEYKYCATSLESLVDFVVSKFGKNVQTFSNEAESENKIQEYIVSKEVKLIGDNQIVCHKQRYAYAVFYCRSINATKAYMVPFVGGDGSKANAIVVCHTDTSAWDPKHSAFHVLNVKPGGPPVCHFLNSNTIVWVPN